MKPAPFAFHQPAAVDEALSLLAQHGDDAVVLAGGQSLTPLLNLRMVRPLVVVDINRVAGLDRIDIAERHVSIGATARARSVELNPQIRQVVPALPQALSYVGHPQIRNRGTIAGMAAFADPAAEIPAVLRCCDGQVEMQSVRGVRAVEAQTFFRGLYQTARDSDELITSVRFEPPPGYRFIVTEHARRHGDYALAGLVVGADLADGVLHGLRLCYFGVGPVPVRLDEVEARFSGVDLDDRTIAAIGGAVESSLQPPGDVHASPEYRRRAAAVLTMRALRALREGSRDERTA